MNSIHQRVFYGWWIVFAAAVGLCFGGPPILVFAFPVFLKAIAKEFHASRSAVALAFTLHNLVSAFAMPFAGRLIDRIGMRKIVLFGTFSFACLMIGNSLINVSIAGIYVFNVVGAALGLSCGPIPYSAAVSKWFDRRRGTALALMMLGIGVAAVILPSLVQHVITALSWRTAYALYGCAMLVIALPVLALVFRNAPAEMGLFPDGASSQSGIDPEGRAGLSSQEARRTPTFWILIAAVVLLGGSVHACVIHLAAMLSDQGITAQTAALASSVAGAGLLTGRVGAGFLLDRFFGPRLAICFSSGAALGVILLLTTHGGLMTSAGAFLVGLGMGSEGDMIAYLTSRYFGLRSFGEIYGLTFGSFVLAGAAGAFLMGFGFDKTGSYNVPLLGFMVAILVSIVLFSRLGPYRYTAHQPSERTVAKSHVAAAAR